MKRFLTTRILKVKTYCRKLEEADQKLGAEPSRAHSRLVTQPALFLFHLLEPSNPEYFLDETGAKSELPDELSFLSL